MSCDPTTFDMKTQGSEARIIHSHGECSALGHVSEKVHPAACTESDMARTRVCLIESCAMRLGLCVGQGMRCGVGRPFAQLLNPTSAALVHGYGPTVHTHERCRTSCETLKLRFGAPSGLGVVAKGLLPFVLFSVTSPWGMALRVLTQWRCNQSTREHLQVWSCV